MKATPLMILFIPFLLIGVKAFLPALDDFGDVYLNSIFDFCPKANDSWTIFHECIAKESSTEDPVKFCNTLGHVLTCNDPLIKSLRGCNHTADDLISLIEAHGKAFQFLCGDGGQRFLDLNSWGPMCALVNPAECSFSPIHNLNDYFVNGTVNSGHYFNGDNCKPLKRTVNCFSASPSTCSEKISLILKSVNNIYFNAMCGDAIFGAA